MLSRQITHDDLGCAAYLTGDERAGVVAVFDPRFRIDEYLELARYRGVTIERVLETHNYAVLHAIDGGIPRLAGHGLELIADGEPAGAKA